MKTAIRISEVIEITDKRVKVKLAKTGEKLWFPITETERYGSWIYIPDWLARRYKKLRHYEYNHNIKKPLS